jgi:hypothetical protein
MQHRPEEAACYSVFLEATNQENTQHTTFCSAASNKHAQNLTGSPGKWSQQVTRKLSDGNIKTDIMELDMTNGHNWIKRPTPTPS